MVLPYQKAHTELTAHHHEKLSKEHAAERQYVPSTMRPAL